MTLRKSGSHLHAGGADFHFLGVDRFVVGIARVDEGEVRALLLRTLRLTLR